MSRRRAVLFLAISLLATPTSLLPATPDPVISYFTNVRDVHIAQPGAQNYFAVDEEIWNRARTDLGDLRLYDPEKQVQYALSVQRGGISSQEETVRILNLGGVRGHTEFDLDMGQIAEYNRIRLHLDAKDFVVTASMAGSHDLGEPVAKLPVSTLYDFSREQLGSNSVLKVPPSSFHYLHVSLAAGISPQQVQGATVYNLQEFRATWTSVGSCASPVQKPRVTVIVCESPARVPVDRIRFQIDGKDVNFRRSVTFTDPAGRVEEGGEITRVRLNRAGTTVVSEEMEVPVLGQSSGQIVISINNGDNPPVAIQSLQLLSIERRVYFDPQGESSLKLYYGDDKLGSPEYDYARFFRAEPDASKAELGPGAHNESYRGRPDERPWSERHSAVLWLAMLVAVAVLAVLVIRGLKART